MQLAVRAVNVGIPPLEVESWQNRLLNVKLEGMTAHALFHRKFEKPATAENIPRNLRYAMLQLSFSILQADFGRADNGVRRSSRTLFQPHPSAHGGKLNGVRLTANSQHWRTPVR
jgi:hypothetical protein